MRPLVAVVIIQAGGGGSLDAVDRWVSVRCLRPVGNQTRWKFLFTYADKLHPVHMLT